jgi:hypothetical protein
MKPTKKQTRIATEVFELMGDYIIAMLEAGEREDEFVWIRNGLSGEILIFARNLDAVKKHISFIPNKDNQPAGKE